MSSWTNVIPVNEYGVPIEDISWVIKDPVTLAGLATGHGTCKKKWNGDASYEYVVDFYTNDGYHTYFTSWSNPNENVTEKCAISSKKSRSLSIHFDSPVKDVTVKGAKSGTVFYNGTGETQQVTTTYTGYDEELEISYSGNKRWTFIRYNDDATIEMKTRETTQMDQPGEYHMYFQTDRPVVDICIEDENGDVVRKFTIVDSEPYHFSTYDYLDSDFDVYIYKNGYKSRVETWNSYALENEAWDEYYDVTPVQQAITYVNVTAKDAKTGEALTDVDWSLSYNGKYYTETSNELRYSYNEGIPTPTWAASKPGYVTKGGNASGVVSLQPEAKANWTITVTAKDYDTGALFAEGIYRFMDKDGNILDSGDNTTGTFHYNFTEDNIPPDRIVKFDIVDGANTYAGQATVTEDMDANLIIGATKYIDVRFLDNNTSVICNYVVKEQDTGTTVKTGQGSRIYWTYDGPIKNFTIDVTASGYEDTSDIVQSYREDLTDMYNTISLTKKATPSIVVTGSTNAGKSGGRYSAPIQFNNFTTVSPSFTSPSWIIGAKYSGGSLVFDVVSNSGTPREGDIIVTNFEGSTKYTATYRVKQQGVTDTCKITLNIKSGSSPFEGGSYSFVDINGTTKSAGINYTGTASYSFTKDSIPENKIKYTFTFNEFTATDTVVVDADTQINIQLMSSGYVNVKYVDSAGNPFVGEAVAIKEYGKGVVTSVLTDSNGIAYYEGLKVGTQYELIIAPAGYQTNHKVVAARDTTGHISLDTVVLSTAADPSVTVTPKNLEAAAGGDQLTATLEMKNFSVEAEPVFGKPAWVTIYYFAPSEMRMFVEENTGAERTATVTVYRYEGTTQYTDSLIIHQAGKNDDYLTVGGTFNVTATDTTTQTCWVSSTDKVTEFGHTAPSASWLIIDSATMLNGLYTIRYHCKENTTQYRRSTTFQVNQGALSKTISIEQSAGQASSTITLSSTGTTISSNAQQITFTARVTGEAVGKPFYITDPTWVSNVSQQWNGDICTFTVTVQANNGATRRELIILAYDTASANYTITQLSKSSTDTKPIWEETTISQPPSSSFLEYHIDDSSSNILYAAKVYKMPDEQQVEWSINEPVSNYLGNSIAFTEGVHKMNDYIKPFTLITSTGFSKTYYFYNSWAYKQTPIGGLLADPIDNRVDPRQFLVCS